MTQATLASRPGVFADAEQAPTAAIARLLGGIGDYRLYRRTVAELRALSMRQREDIGIDGEDMAELARAATRRT